MNKKTRTEVASRIQPGDRIRVLCEIRGGPPDWIREVCKVDFTRRVGGRYVIGLTGPAPGEIGSRFSVTLMPEDEVEVWIETPEAPEQSEEAPVWEGFNAKGKEGGLRLWVIAPAWKVRLGDWIEFPTGKGETERGREARVCLPVEYIDASGAGFHFTSAQDHYGRRYHLWGDSPTAGVTFAVPVRPGVQ